MNAPYATSRSTSRGRIPESRKTSDSGTYEFTDLGAGAYSITASSRRRRPEPRRHSELFLDAAPPCATSISASLGRISFRRQPPYPQLPGSRQRQRSPRPRRPVARALALPSTPAPSSNSAAPPSGSSSGGGAAPGAPVILGCGASLSGSEGAPTPPPPPPAPIVTATPTVRALAQRCRHAHAAPDHGQQAAAERARAALAGPGSRGPGYRSGSRRRGQPRRALQVGSRRLGGALRRIGVAAIGMALVDGFSASTADLRAREHADAQLRREPVAADRHAGADGRAGRAARRPLSGDDVRPPGASTISMQLRNGRPVRRRRSAGPCERRDGEQGQSVRNLIVGLMGPSSTMIRSPPGWPRRAPARCQRPAECVGGWPEPGSGPRHRPVGARPVRLARRAGGCPSSRLHRRRRVARHRCRSV